MIHYFFAKVKNNGKVRRNFSDKAKETAYHGAKFTNIHILNRIKLLPKAENRGNFCNFNKILIKFTKTIAI